MVKNPYPEIFVIDDDVVNKLRIKKLQKEKNEQN